MTERLRATDALVHMGISRCDRRVWVKADGTIEAKEPSELKIALGKLGLEHEAKRAAEFPDLVDLGDVKPLEEQVRRTAEEVEKGEMVTYQGALVAHHDFGDGEVEIVGLPDFIIPVDGGHVIQDAKLARSIDDKPGIELQLQIYGWLFEQVVGEPLVGLEVFSGQGEVIPLSLDNGAALAELAELYRLSNLGSEPFEVVGWSKCQTCDYTDHCWKPAFKARQPGVLPDVDVGMGKAFAAEGLTTFDEIPRVFDVESLAEFPRPWGRKTQRVGETKAVRIMRSVESFENDEPIVFATPEIPEHEHYVMFDLEGLPPEEDGPDRVYLWGMQVYPADGSPPDEAVFPLAGFGEGGDEQGWFDFLAGAATIMDGYGESIPFVHWSAYEKTKIRKYIELYGDPDGIAEQILEVNLLDLLPITRNSVTFPLPSYSLKVLEEYLGYERKLEGYKGDKSIARYMEAADSNDQSHRDEIVAELCQYNGEDLEATWVVQKWLMGVQVGITPVVPSK